MSSESKLYESAWFLEESCAITRYPWGYIGTVM